MPARLSATLTLAALLAHGPAIAQPGPRDLLRDASEIRLHTGVNRIADFAGNGRAALLTLGWRENGNAHGYLLFSVMLPPSRGSRSWNIVGVDRGDRFDDTIADAPHTGEDVVTSVRFVRVTQHRRTRTLLVIATRNWQESIPNPAFTTIDIFALKRSNGDIGVTADYFSRILSFRTTKKYCNADFALKQEAGLSLPPDYPGIRSTDGC